MALDASPRRPMHLWVVGIVSLESYISQFTPEQGAYFTSFPAWATSAWAFGVWGALAGSIGLLLGRSWAVWAFALSLAGLAVSTVYQFALTDAAGIMGNVGMIMTIVIWVVAILLLWYAVRQKQRGVLR
jgi:hypothetical protein